MGEALDVPWFCGSYRVDECGRVNSVLTTGYVRPVGSPTGYTLSSGWDGGASEQKSVAVALARVEVAVDFPDYPIIPTEVRRSIESFYSSWGPLGLAHHGFDRQWHAPTEPGFVHIHKGVVGGYRQLCEGLECRYFDFPKGDGWPPFPGGTVPECEQSRPMMPMTRSAEAQVSSKGPYYAAGLEPACKFYRFWLPAWREEDRFPSILDRAFRDFYAEPTSMVILAIEDFQRAWEEAERGNFYRGPVEDRNAWLRTRVLPHLGKVHVSLQPGEGGRLQHCLFAPSLLAAAYYELAALVCRGFLRKCLGCGERFVGAREESVCCSKRCDNRRRQHKRRHPGCELPIYRKKEEGASL